MKLSEDEFKQLHKDICNNFARHYQFDIYNHDDISQEIAIMIIEGLKHYNPNKSALKTFIWGHVKKRLVNLKRDFWARSDIPPESEPERREIWLKIQEAKIAIKRPSSIVANHNDEEFEQVDEALVSYDPPVAEIKELQEIIDGLPAPIRKIWISWQAGEFINDKDKETLINAVKQAYSQ